MTRVAAAVRGFWFEPATPTNLAFSRIFFYAALLAYYWNIDTGQWAHVPDVYWVPVGPFAYFGWPVLSETALQWMDVVWKVSLAFACIGFFTRPSTVVAAVLGLYLLALPHSFGKVHHNDALIVLALVVLAVSRCGDAFSADRWLRQGSARKAEEGPPPKSPEFRWPLQVLRVLLVLAFFGAGLTKLRKSGIEWILSDSLAYMFVNHHYTHGPLHDAGLAIARFGPLTRLMAAGSVLVELAVPLALFSRHFRRVLIPSLFLMQAGILVLMGVPFVQFSFLYLFWIPYDRILEQAKRMVWRPPAPQHAAWQDQTASPVPVQRPRRGPRKAARAAR